MEPTFSNFEKDGETVEVANFTLVKNTVRVMSTQLCRLWRKSREGKGL